MSKIDRILQKAREHHLSSKLPVKKCIELALEEVIGNEEISFICSNFGAIKKDLVEFLEMKFRRKYGI